MLNKKILVLVCGMSPQIITETLYALIHQSPSWVPDEIHLITTLMGKQNAILQLLENQKNFYQFLKDYKIDKSICFNAQTIHLITYNQTPLNDLKTPQENEAAADAICRVIAELTQNENNQLHVSLAGGRKTMGFYAGYALSLFGRTQDKLSHVLVSEGFESHRDFYYPTPYPKYIQLNNGRFLNAQDAQIWLAEIPFVRLRQYLKPHVLPINLSFGQIIASVQWQNYSTIVFNIKKLDLKIQNILVPLSRIEFILYRVLLEYAKTKQIFQFKKNQVNTEITEKFKLYDQKIIKPIDPRTENVLHTKGIDFGYLQPIKSKLNKKLKKYLPEKAYATFCIQTANRGLNCYYIDIQSTEFECLESL
jgi:CRISPR-associated protein (TIGR02584 family)